PHTPDLYTLSLHDALPILNSAWWFFQNVPLRPRAHHRHHPRLGARQEVALGLGHGRACNRSSLSLSPTCRPCPGLQALGSALDQDRKSTRLNSSHLVISYA